ncbi:ATP-binding protein [Qingshengfaniella alkalisoli]|uniref:histidine kinase n=1 Tax=Qingshengfaniella alkalisoli TaxID=2599296 RepID=A0A5B8IZB2_9RHOB|nr:response regulator [Qingshengfaniella alkalisoli]
MPVARCLAVAGFVVLAVSIWFGNPVQSELGSIVGLVVLGPSLAVLAISGYTRKRRGDFFSTLQAMFGSYPMPMIATSVDGRIEYTNGAAADVADGASLIFHCLDHEAADSSDLAARLILAAARDGYAFEDKHLNCRTRRISVSKLQYGFFLWRIEELFSPDSKTGPVSLPVFSLGEDNCLTPRTPSAIKLLGGERIEARLQNFDATSRNVQNLDIVIGKQLLHRSIVAAQTATGYEIYCLPEELEAAATQSPTMDALPVPLLKVRRDGTIVAANRSVRDLLDDDIIPGIRLSELISGLGRPVEDWLSEVAEGRGLQQSEFLRLASQDRDKYVQVTLKRSVERGEVFLIAVLNDATELKTLEAQFVQSQKMQAIGQLAGGIAHDFNNLLTAISGHCDLMLLRHAPDDGDYGDLVQIHQNANRAASLVGQLLAFSRKQTLQTQFLDLREGLADLTHLLNRLVGERVTLTLRHSPDGCGIRADKRQLEQVIMNLVVNARDAMPDGGEIVIETQSVDLESELHRNRAIIPPGRYVVVRVIDQGEGIPVEQLSKIFEPFYTTKKAGEGTGLGLSTAYGIVKQTGGFIFANSTVGCGTIFTLYFPLHTERETPPEEPVEQVPRVDEDRCDGIILLVEDEAPVRAFASRALQLKGFTVLEAENAEEALAILADKAVEVDVFVTDVVMPGMDGPTWVQKALSDRPDTRVVFVSGYAEDALNDHELKIPNSVFLPKPFSLQQLTSVVQHQIRRC